MLPKCFTRFILIEHYFNWIHGKSIRALNYKCYIDLKEWVLFVKGLELQWSAKQVCSKVVMSMVKKMEVVKLVRSKG